MFSLRELPLSFGTMASHAKAACRTFMNSVGRSMSAGAGQTYNFSVYIEREVPLLRVGTHSACITYVEKGGTGKVSQEGVEWRSTNG